MRAQIRMGLVAACVLGMVATAGATTVAGVTIPNGPIVIKFANFDVGAVYRTANGVYQGESTLNGLPQTPPTGGVGNEDSWAIVRVDTISDSTQMNTYYNRYTSPMEITGILWGGRDTYLDQTGSGLSLAQDIHGVGVYAAFFAGTPKNFNATPGPSARLPDGSYPTATDGELIWTFKSVPGWNTAFPADEFFTTYRPNATVGDTSANGGMFAALSTVPVFGTGSLNGDLDPDGIASGVAARLDFTGRVGTNGWLVNSDDPMLVTVIPEPMTMLMLTMGITGLSGYVYKRRKS